MISLLIKKNKKKKKKGGGRRRRRRRRRRSGHQTDRYEKLKNSHAIHLPRAFYSSALLPCDRSLPLDVGEPFHSQFGQVMEEKKEERENRKTIKRMAGNRPAKTLKFCPRFSFPTFP